MNKLRSDSAFCQLTPQQADTLEGWLFEERLSYPKVLEKLKGEFGVETSLTGLRRFYKRLDVERSAQSLMDAAEMSGMTVQALKSGELKPAMLLFANKCLFELLRQSPVPIKEVTTLLRAITSAESHAMRREIRDQDEAERRESERVRQARESWRMTPRDLEEEKEERRQERAARKKAKLEAAHKKNVGEAKVEKNGHLSPSLSPRGGESVKTGAPVVSASPKAFDSLASRGTSGERAGERGSDISTEPDDAKIAATENAVEAWRPSVVEGEENCMAE